jgi:CheY-like chemotaxis protein
MDEMAGAMPGINFDRRRGLGSGANGLARPAGRGVNLSLVLIICSSPINRIVVSRIVEQTGLKAICEPPQSAVETMFARQPGLVILDSGPKDDEHHHIAPAIVDHRRASGSTLPMLIVLSTKVLSPDSPFANIADAVVSKPITPDALQPKIEQLVEDARG